MALKTVEKYSGSENPESNATFLIESIPLSKSVTAYFIRRFLRYSEKLSHLLLSIY
mgnify:CR=1 FL=1